MLDAIEKTCKTCQYDDLPFACLECIEDDVNTHYYWQPKPLVVEVEEVNIIECVFLNKEFDYCQLPGKPPCDTSYCALHKWSVLVKLKGKND